MNNSVNSMERSIKFSRDIKAICPVCGKVVDIEISDYSRIKIGTHEEDLEMIACTPMMSHYLIYCHKRMMINCRYSFELDFCKLLLDIGCDMTNVFFAATPTETTTLFGIDKCNSAYRDDETWRYSEPFISFHPTSDKNGITFDIILDIINHILSDMRYDKIKVITYDPSNEEEEYEQPEHWNSLDARFDERLINITIILDDRSNTEEYRSCMNQFGRFYTEFAREIKEVQNNG